MTTYVGLAIADSMFPANCTITRQEAPLPLVHKMLETDGCEPVVNCCNPSHVATLRALKVRYSIDLAATVPSSPPHVAAKPGDAILVLAVHGLPRLTDRHEYTVDEIEKATFKFGLWLVR